ncbi:NUDIX domain-containing protein, partial [bacterium]|nr:NUDIX domain-containing protein [bacterium]
RRVAAAVIIEDGRLMLARRLPGDRLAGLWELPGGKIEPGETPQQCLERELLEELGLSSQADELLATTTYHYEHGSFEMLALRTTRSSEVELLAHDAVAWVRREDLATHPLAPADIELVQQLLSNSHW